MAKDLKKMAGNGYGHYLRNLVPETEKKLKRYKREKEELKKRMDSIDWLINFETKNLEEDKKDLQQIETEYSQYEPRWEDWI